MKKRVSVCDSCREECKQADFVRVAYCPNYKEKGAHGGVKRKSQVQGEKD